MIHLFRSYDKKLVLNVPPRIFQLSMLRSLIQRITCAGVLLASGSQMVFATDVQRTMRELVQYIQEARKLGLQNNQILQNAQTAGWNKQMIEEAFTVVRYLDTGVQQPEPEERTPQATSKLLVPDSYRIGAGDMLQIVVWKEPDASVPSTIVRADGKISIPLIKEVDVMGLTPLELERMLTERISKLIHGADVTVIVKEITSRKVYMLGGLKKEGPLMLPASMTVLQAINAAGGLSEYAKRKKIYILRNENGQQQRLPFDYQAVIKGERMEQNILLRPDDTVVVPQ
jgi:polysaccharide export outer membrane protein